MICPGAIVLRGVVPDAPARSAEAAPGSPSCVHQPAERGWRITRLITAPLRRGCARSQRTSRSTDSPRCRTAPRGRSSRGGACWRRRSENCRRERGCAPPTRRSRRNGATVQYGRGSLRSAAAAAGRLVGGGRRALMLRSVPPHLAVFLAVFSPLSPPLAPLKIDGLLQSEKAEANGDGSEAPRTKTGSEHGSSNSSSDSADGGWVRNLALPFFRPRCGWLRRLNIPFYPQTPTKAWQTALGRVLFEPVGVPTEALFCWDEQHAKDIRDRNPSLRVRLRLPCNPGSASASRQWGCACVGVASLCLRFYPFTACRTGRRPRLPEGCRPAVPSDWGHGAGPAAARAAQASERCAARGGGMWPGSPASVCVMLGAGKACRGPDALPLPPPVHVLCVLPGRAYFMLQVTPLYTGVPRSQNIRCG